MRTTIKYSLLKCYILLPLVNIVLIYNIGIYKIYLPLPLLLCNVIILILGLYTDRREHLNNLALLAVLYYWIYTLYHYFKAEF